MFEKTEEGSQAPISPPPHTPVLLTFKGHDVLWQALFKAVPPRHRPPFVVLFVEDQLDVVEANNTEVGDLAALTNPTIRETIITPLVARLRDRYEDGTHLIVSPRGVWACDKQDAISAVMTGVPPRHPDEYTLEVPALLDRCWNFARLFAKSRDPRIRAIGLLIIFPGFLFLSGSFFSSWLFATYMLGEAMHSAFKGPIPAPLWAFQVAATVISIVEIVCVFVPPLRWLAVVTNGLDIALHGWYGTSIGRGRSDPALIVGLWAAGFGGLAVAPEYAFVLCAGMVYYTAPLLLDIRGEVKRFVRGFKAGWNRPVEDIVEGEYTVDETHGGRRVTRYLRG